MQALTATHWLARSLRGAGPLLASAVNKNAKHFGRERAKGANPWQPAYNALRSVLLNIRRILGRYMISKPPNKVKNIA